MDDRTKNGGNPGKRSASSRRSPEPPDFPEPGVHEGSVLVEAVAVGVCGTDVERASS